VHGASTHEHRPEGDATLLAEHRTRSATMSNKMTMPQPRIAGHFVSAPAEAGEVLWMRVPYGEGVASHTDPESCGCTRKGAVEALTGARAGWAIEPRKVNVRDAEALLKRPRPHQVARHARAAGSRGVEDPTHARKHLAREDNPLVRKPGGPAPDL